MDNEKIKNLLRLAGVPKETVTTTLAVEGFLDLREYIAGEGWENKDVIYIYPEEGDRAGQYARNAERAELAFYLFVKEMVLARHDIQSCSLVDIHSILFKEEEDDYVYQLAGRINACNFLAIAHFTEAGGRAEQFMSAYERAYFTSWLIRKHQNGCGIALLGASCLDSYANDSEWWAGSFLGYLRSRAISFTVSAK